MIAGAEKLDGVHARTRNFPQQFRSEFTVDEKIAREYSLHWMSGQSGTVSESPTEVKASESAFKPSFWLLPGPDPCYLAARNSDATRLLSSDESASRPARDSAPFWKQFCSSKFW